jgi:Flp pilus assembly protein TadB
MTTSDTGNLVRDNMQFLSLAVSILTVVAAFAFWISGLPTRTDTEKSNERIEKRLEKKIEQTEKRLERRLVSTGQRLEQQLDKTRKRTLSKEQFATLKERVRSNRAGIRSFDKRFVSIEKKLDRLIKIFYTAQIKDFARRKRRR